MRNSGRFASFALLILFSGGFSIGLPSWGRASVAEVECRRLAGRPRAENILERNTAGLPVLVIVDAVSSGNLIAPEARKMGFYVVHVHSKGRPLPAFQASFTGAGIQADLPFDGSLASTAERIARFGNVVAVIPGGEAGVDFTARLQGALKNRFPEISSDGIHPEYRDKVLLGEALARAGLPHARQLRATSARQAIEWIEREKLMKDRARSSDDPFVVLKPPKSSSTEDVIYCYSIEDVERAFQVIYGKKNKYSVVNDSVLVQEFLSGPEYVVNLVRAVDPSSGRVVTKVTDIWAYNKRRKPGGATLYDYDTLLDPQGALQDALVKIVIDAADALGHRVGSVHAEVIAGRVVDFGARMMGAGQPRVVAAATGHSQVDVGILAYTDPVRFAQLPDRYTKVKDAVVISLPSELARGHLSLASLEKLKRLPSLLRYHFNYRPGQFVKETLALGEIVGQVELVNSDLSALERDREWVRAQTWVVSGSEGRSRRKP